MIMGNYWEMYKLKGSRISENFKKMVGKYNLISFVIILMKIQKENSELYFFETEII